MQRIGDRKKLLILLISIISGLAIIITTVLATVLPRLNSFTSSNKTAVTIEEMWDGSKFNSANVKTLLATLSNNSNGTIDAISSNIDSSSGDVITAAQIRNYTTNKSSGQSVIVTLGGFEWIVTYLSKSKQGDVVATLWLSGEDTLDTSTFGNSSRYYGPDSTSGYPTAMYGTSYIRAKLNNGGNYIEIENNNSNPTSVTGSYSPVSNYKFADFVQDGVLTEYMVTPANISWQESGQSAKTTLSWIYNVSNENWSKDTPDTGFYSSGYNYAHKEYSDTWKDDYLWLPSMSETGYNDTYPGMWSLNTNERSYNSSGSSTYSWSRSANYSYSSTASYLYSSGVNCSNITVSNSYAVRPALHLNLTAILYKTIIVNYDSSQGSVTGAGKYLPGESITLTANPNPNYRFVSWTNSAGTILSTNPEYTFGVTDDMTITANFELITYNVTINVNDNALGQVLFNNNLTTNTTTEQVINTTLTLYAIANPNSAFICWQITIGGSTTYDYEHNPLTTTITADTTITAIFTNSLMEGIGVTAIGGGQVRMGGYDLDNVDSTTQVVLNAICYSGYTFDGWYTMENGVLTKIEELGNSTAVTINVAAYDGKLIIARFVPNSNGNVNDDTNNS